MSKDNEMIDVELANGKFVPVPRNVIAKGKESTIAYMVANKAVTWQALQEMGESDTSAVGPDGGETISQIGDWSMENMDTLLPVAASIGTSMVTGGVAAPIAAGAIATAAGKYISDTAKAEEGEIVDPLDSLYEGGVSAAIDIGTLGITKLTRPMLRVMGYGNKEADELIAAANRREAADEGSQESLIQTQNLLTNSGVKNAGLTATQSKRASTFVETIEGLVDASPFTRQASISRANANNAVIQEGFQNIIQGIPFTNLGANAIGTNLNELITVGKQALSSNYQALSEPWMRNFGGIQLQPNLLGKVIDNARETSAIRATVKTKKKPTPSETMSPGRTGATDAGGVPTQKKIADKFEQETLQLLDDLDDLNSSVVYMSAKNLLAMQQKLRNAVTKAGSFDANYNGPLEQQLSKLSDDFTAALEETIRLKNPRAADDLIAMNAQYKEGINSLLPPINKTALQSAGEGYVEALGNLAVRTTEKSKIDGMKKSIYQAYAEAKKAGTLNQMPFKTADEAFATFRAGYIKQLLPNLHSDAFDIVDYRNLAKQFETPSAQEAAKAVMGKDFGNFKSLLNAMSEATKTPDSLLGSLMVTSRTASAGQSLAGASLGAIGIGAATGSGLAAAASGGAWILAPKVLQKIVSNPKAVNMFLSLEQRSKKEKLTPTFVMSGIAKIMNSLSEEEQAAIRNIVSENVLGAVKAVNDFETPFKEINLSEMSQRSGEGIVRYRPPMSM